MAIYMVERNLPGLGLAELGGAQKAAIETARRFTAEGEKVSYLRTAFVPGDARCFCFFEAASQDAVRKVNEAAQLPFTNIVEALDLPAPRS